MPGNLKLKTGYVSCENYRFSLESISNTYPSDALKPLERYYNYSHVFYTNFTNQLVSL